MGDIRAQLFFVRPAAIVYRAWIDPLQLGQWLALRAEVEPKVGGAYELFWDPKRADRNCTKGCRFYAVAPNRRLAFDWKGPDHFHDVMNRGPLTKVEVRFDRTDDGSRVDFIHFGFGEGSDWERALKWQRRAWQVAFERLQALLA